MVHQDLARASLALVLLIRSARTVTPVHAEISLVLIDETVL